MTEGNRGHIGPQAPSGDGAGMSPRRNAPDPEALVIAREMQERLQPAEIILLGSQAVGEHRHDSDVDLMAVAPDEAGVKEADESLRYLLEGKYDDPVVNVTTITRESSSSRRHWPNPGPDSLPATA